MSENTGTPTQGNWEADFPKDDKKKGRSGGGDGDRRQVLYMNFRDEGEYVVRLAGPYVVFLKHWDPVRCITHMDYGRSHDPMWEAGFNPQKRFAVNVIDRADGQLKVLEAGTQVFQAFANCARVNKIDPAGKDGPDFNITVEIPNDDNGRPNPRRKTYTTEPTLGSKLFTTEEVAMIKEQKLYPLSKIYKAASMEKIQELWDNVPEDQRIPKESGNTDNNKKAEAAEASEVVEAVAVDNIEDLFPEGENADGQAEAADLF